MMAVEALPRIIAEVDAKLEADPLESKTDKLNPAENKRRSLDRIPTQGGGDCALKGDRQGTAEIDPRLMLLMMEKGLTIQDRKLATMVSIWDLTEDGLLHSFAPHKNEGELVSIRMECGVRY